jgi:hypothetical protein
LARIRSLPMPLPQVRLPVLDMLMSLLVWQL